MVCGCKILTVFKSGTIRKSPPVVKLLKNYKFKPRHCTLGINELCSKCSHDGSFDTKKLVFSYYSDDSEKCVKKRFEVENSRLEQVHCVIECPEKFAHEKYILRWTLKKYRRTLYLLFDDEDELKSWLHIFQKYKEMRRSNLPELEDETLRLNSIGSNTSTGSASGSSRHAST